MRRAPCAQVRYGHNGRQIRWEEIAADPEKPPVAFKDQGVYLITGGMGGLNPLRQDDLEQASGARVI
jgi:hypothetical protein